MGDFFQLFLGGTCAGGQFEFAAHHASIENAVNHASTENASHHASFAFLCVASFAMLACWHSKGASTRFTKIEKFLKKITLYR